MRGRTSAKPKARVTTPAEHHHALDWAIWKHGRRLGELSHMQLMGGFRGITRREAGRLGCMNPYAAELWERCLRRAAIEHGLDQGPPYMATILDRRWHFPVDRWALDLKGIVAQARRALRGVSYLLLVETALLDYLGYRQVAPHLQGFIFEPLSRRRRQAIAEHFAGGVARAPALWAEPVWDFVGASRYSVKPPTYVARCYRGRDGRLVHRGRDLRLTEHFYLWRHLHPLTYLDLTFAGGLGRGVLRDALRLASAHP